MCVLFAANTRFGKESMGFKKIGKVGFCLVLGFIDFERQTIPDAFGGYCCHFVRRAVSTSSS